MAAAGCRARATARSPRGVASPSATPSASRRARARPEVLAGVEDPAARGDRLGLAGAGRRAADVAHLGAAARSARAARRRQSRRQRSVSSQ